MGRMTQTIGPATAVTNVPEAALEVERAALDALPDLDDDAFVEVEINEPHATRAEEAIDTEPLLDVTVLQCT